MRVLAGEGAPIRSRYTRCREYGSVIGVYDSLYLLSLLGSACKIQSRSSFGP